MALNTSQLFSSAGVASASMLENEQARRTNHMERLRMEEENRRRRNRQLEALPVAPENLSMGWQGDVVPSMDQGTTGAGVAGGVGTTTDTGTDPRAGVVPPELVIPRGREIPWDARAFEVSVRMKNTDAGLKRIAEQMYGKYMPFSAPRQSTAPGGAGVAFRQSSPSGLREWKNARDDFAKRFAQVARTHGESAAYRLVQQELQGKSLTMPPGMGVLAPTTPTAEPTERRLQPGMGVLAPTTPTAEPTEPGVTARPDQTSARTERPPGPTPGVAPGMPGVAPGMEKRAEQYQPLVQQAAQKYNIPVGVLNALISTESSWDPAAVSPRGAKGLGQIMDGTAPEIGVTDAFDPAQGIDGAARYLRQLLDSDAVDGDMRKALTAYNGGRGNLTRRGGLELGHPGWTKETREYPDKILGLAGQSDTQTGAKPKTEEQRQAQARKDITAKITPALGKALASDPERVSYDTRVLMQQRAELVRMAELARNTGGDAEMQQFNQYRQDIRAVDERLRYMQGMDAANHFQITGDTRRLARVWSNYEMGDVQIIPTTEGKYTVVAAGRVIAENVSETDMVQQATLKMSEAARERLAAAQAQRAEWAFELQKARVGRAGIRAIETGEGTLLYGLNPDGSTLADLVDPGTPGTEPGFIGGLRGVEATPATAPRRVSIPASGAVGLGLRTDADLIVNW